MTTPYRREPTETIDELKATIAILRQESKAAEDKRREKERWQQRLSTVKNIFVEKHVGVRLWVTIIIIIIIVAAITWGGL